MRIPLGQLGEPEATVRMVTPRHWWIEVHHGMVQWGPGGSGWNVWGLTPGSARRRADRKARRALAKYRRELNRRTGPAHVVTEKEALL